MDKHQEDIDNENIQQNELKSKIKKEKKKSQKKKVEKGPETEEDDERGILIGGSGGSYEMSKTNNKYINY